MKDQINTPPKKAKTRSLLTGLLIALGVLIALNLLSSYFYHRFDFSKGRIYTLSQTSKNLVRNLRDNLVANVYLSDNLPAQYNLLARYARDLLGEYDQFGGRRFSHEIVSRVNEDEFRGRAERDNIFAQRTVILENDKQTVRDIYMGMSFEYKGNRESLNLTQGMENRLEYEITALLRRLTKTQLPAVGLYQDSLYMAEAYKTFDHHLRKDYQVQQLDLNQPFNTPVLVFPGVIDSLSELQLYNLDQYIMHGGKVIFLQDRVWGDVRYSAAQTINSNLFRLLENYAIEIKNNLVLDQNCLPVNMSQRSGIFVFDVPVLYPPIPLVQGLDTNPITKGLSDIPLLFCSELNTTVKNKSVSITPLLKTSPATGIINGPEFDIDPNRFVEEKAISNLSLSPVTVAALYAGEFTSFYAKNSAYAATPGFSGRTNESEIIVVGDSDLIMQTVTQNFDSGVMFVLNAIDYLLKDVSLTEVRSRTVTDSPLDLGLWLYQNNVQPERIQQVEPKLRLFVKVANLLLPSLLLIGYGFYRMVSEKRCRQAIQRRFHPTLITTEESANGEAEAEAAATPEPGNADEEKPLD